METRPTKPVLSYDTFTVDGEHSVTIEGIDLPDGRLIGASYDIRGNWDDGAFDWEQGSQKGTHRYALAFTVDTSQLTNVWDMTTQTPIQVDAALKAELDALMETIEDKVEEEISAEPPSPSDSGPDPDYERDQDIDRSFDR